jgi:hypothetical protein
MHLVLFVSWQQRSDNTMLFLRRCLSVAYSPQRRECRLSGFDQRDSRILYDPLFDYYENLVTGVPPPLGESANFLAHQEGLIDEIFLRARVCWPLLCLIRPSHKQLSHPSPCQLSQWPPISLPPLSHPSP